MNSSAHRPRSQRTELPVQTLDKGLCDPQTLARGMVVEQDHPVLGQHNREIAARVGFSASDIDAMERDGVLYSEKQP